MDIQNVKKPIVINFAGAPGAGKSTGAAFVFSILKRKGYNCELVTEFAKDKTWEHNDTALSCQEYVFGKQSYRLARCREDVDIIITDSPLPLGLIYVNNPALDEHFEKTVMNIFNTYTNFNIFVERAKPYNPKGRNQTEEEANALSHKIRDMYNRLNIPFYTIHGTDEDYIAIAEAFIEFYKKLTEEPV